MPARYKGMTGTIEFVDDAYITLCINCKEMDEHAFKRVSKCCMVIYPEYWDDLEIEDEHFYDHKAYRGTTETTQAMIYCPILTTDKFTVYYEHCKLWLRRNLW